MTKPKVSRRRFIRGCGVAGATIVLTGQPLQGCSSLETEHNSESQEEALPHRESTSKDAGSEQIVVEKDSQPTEEAPRKITLNLNHYLILKSVGGSAIISGAAGVLRILHRTQGVFQAISLVCPHRACVVGWQKEDNRFRCSCHGASFDANGGLLRGPARRGLSTFKTEYLPQENKLYIFY